MKFKVGKHKDVSIRKFDKTQLEKGTNVELEHTTSINMARQIAKDHLMEFPDYYDRLEVMERPDFWTLVEHNKQGKEITTIPCKVCNKGVIIYDKNDHIITCSKCNHKMKIIDVIIKYRYSE